MLHQETTIGSTKTNSTAWSIQNSNSLNPIIAHYIASLLTPTNPLPPSLSLSLQNIGEYLIRGDKSGVCLVMTLWRFLGGRPIVVVAWMLFALLVTLLGCCQSSGSVWLPARCLMGFCGLADCSLFVFNRECFWVSRADWFRLGNAH